LLQHHRIAALVHLSTIMQALRAPAALRAPPPPAAGRRPPHPSATSASAAPRSSSSVPVSELLLLLTAPAAADPEEARGLAEALQALCYVVPASRVLCSGSGVVAAAACGGGPKAAAAAAAPTHAVHFRLPDAAAAAAFLASPAVAAGLDNAAAQYDAVAALCFTGYVAAGSMEALFRRGDAFDGPGAELLLLTTDAPGGAPAERAAFLERLEDMLRAAGAAQVTRGPVSEVGRRGLPGGVSGALLARFPSLEQASFAAAAAPVKALLAGDARLPVHGAGCFVVDVAPPGATHSAAAATDLARR